ncbi:MAG: outer membrane protein assembly factor BamB [Burkholderiaceae bacterium]|jgi:outer membrane assembly lipoprotein YfgL|nr:outer membrane protein assembly factor BamB [Burkholderiaceae bacterium]
MTVWRALGAALAALVLLAGCSGSRPKPTPLEPLKPAIAGRQVWSQRVDGVPFPLVVAVQGERFVVAGGDGTLLGLEAEDGRVAWRASAGAPIVAGVGTDGRFVAVVTRDNELVTLEDGQVKWRRRLPARVSSAPLVAGERVFVLAVDRAVHAFDAVDGRRLWELRRQSDALTLAQAGVLHPYRNLLLVGQGPRLAAVDPLRGTVRWEVPIAAPRGTNEVERLADLVGPPLRLGNTLCARAFQQAVGCIDLERTSPVWSRAVGGTQAIGGDAERLFGADGSDRITAWRTGSGEILWTNESFLYRGLSGALAVGPTVVFGDVEGQVHWLAADTGQPLLRLATDGSAVVGTPVLARSTVLVVTRRGGLFAFRPV